MSTLMDKALRLKIISIYDDKISKKGIDVDLSFLLFFRIKIRPQKS
jgi:hypothetical protein